MLVALYVGDHRDDTLLVRLGWKATRIAQRGIFRRVTHVEAILRRNPDGSVVIGSSTLRPENNGHDGVRVKHDVHLRAGSWRIFDVPSWDVAKAWAYFNEHDGWRYDKRGALGTVFPLVGHNPRKKFCNGAVGDPFIPSAHTLGPAQFAIIVSLLGYEITDEFFAARSGVASV